MFYPTEKDFINIHSHKKAFAANEWTLRNAFDKLTGNQILALNYPLSVGVHPWHSENPNLDKVKSNLSLKNVMALGEIGLDRACDIPFAIQTKILLKQLEINKIFKKPVILHCVKAYSDIMPYLKKYDFPFVFHQYNGNSIQTQQLLKLQNVYFSFGKDLYKTHQKTGMVFREIPDDRLFLETDTSTFSITEIYQKASEIKECDISLLKKQVFYNFETVFK